MVNQSNKVLNTNITNLVNKTYQYGFSTNIEKDIIEKGLNEETIYLISKKKKRTRFSFKISIKSL
jgi:Fe-S cluster assembly protein SufB